MKCCCCSILWGYCNPPIISSVRSSHATNKREPQTVRDHFRIFQSCNHQLAAIRWMLLLLFAGCVQRRCRLPQCTRAAERIARDPDVTGHAAALHTHTVQYSSTYSIKGSFYFFASFLLSLLFDYYGIHNVSRGIFSFLISSNECQNGVKPLPTYLNLNSNDDDNGLCRKNLKKNRPGEWRPSSFTFPRPFIHNNKRIKPKMPKQQKKNLSLSLPLVSSPPSHK